MSLGEEDAAQCRRFACDLFLDFASDFALAFRFDDMGRAGRLDQEVDLATAAPRVSLVAIGSGRYDDAVAKMQEGEDIPSSLRASGEPNEDIPLEGRLLAEN